MDRLRDRPCGHHLSTSRPHRVALALGLAAAGFATALWLFWPGVALYDTVAQYEQVRSGLLYDWHPPIMVALWRLLTPFGPGAAPMLVVQLGGWWLGLGLLAAALAGAGWTARATALLCIALCPLFLGWQSVVLKDAQLVAALVTAVGLIGWWRLRERPVPSPVIALAVLLLAYAALVRANAIFAVAPLAVGLTQIAGWQRRVGLVLAATAAVLASAPVVAHHLLGAQPTGVERTQPVYDLAGIAVRAGGGPYLPEERTALVGRRCLTPFFWDPLGDETRCGSVTRRVWAIPPAALYRQLAAEALRHPLAYLAHRLAHFNSTERWLVPAGWAQAGPPARGEPNDLGLSDPGRAATIWQTVAARIAATPLGWPAAWLALALSALAASLGRPPTPPRRLAHGLLASAVTLEASFLVVSIASDLRYHLWPMVATAVAVTLLAGDAARLRRRALIGGGIGLALVVATGTAARLVLPRAPDTYQGMLLNHWD